MYQRLANLVGMLGSDYDGERANAARLATNELRRLGLTWAELVRRAFAGLTQQAPPPPWGASPWASRPPPSYTPPPSQEEPEPSEPNFDGWEHAARPYSARPRPGQRTNKDRGVRLWDFVRGASLNRMSLTAWEMDFLKALLERGPNVRATQSEWRIIHYIKGKLELEEQ